VSIVKSPVLRRLAATTAILGAAALPALASAGPATAAAVPAAKTCKSVTTNISYLKIAKLGTKQARGVFTCQQANVIGNTWMLRFKAHMQVQTLKVNSATYRCKLVPTLPRNTQCDGAGTRVVFAAPTGG
jgi:hypothetical protein